MSDIVLFNNENLKEINTENKKEVANNINSDHYVFELEASAPLCAWNYIEKYPVDSGEFIFHNDIDAIEFDIVPKKSDNKIIIEIETKNPFEALQQITEKLFNEKSQEYSNEYGYSGWDLSCHIAAISNDNKYLIDIHQYDVRSFEIF